MKKRKPPEKISGHVPESKRPSRIKKTPKPKNPKEVLSIGPRASLGHAIKEKENERPITKGRKSLVKKTKSMSKRKRKA